MAGIEVAQTERQMRDLESIINGAKTTADRVSGIANRLRDMRSRLLGIDENEVKESNVNEVVGSEISDLRITLRSIDTTLDSIEEYVSSLENV